MTQPHRLSCPGVTCDGTPRAHPPPRPGPGALPAPAPGAFSPSPFPEGESARHHHIPLPESSPQAPAAVACLRPSASRPRSVCTRPPSRGATSTEPQGLSALCDSESGDPGAGDESHWRGPAERSAWLRGGPGGGGSFKAGPSWSAGGRGGAARGYRHATLARVFAWADSHLRKQRQARETAPSSKSGLAEPRLSARSHEAAGLPGTQVAQRGPTAAPGRGRAGPGHIRVGICSGDRRPIYMPGNRGPETRRQRGARVCACDCVRLYQCVCVCACTRVLPGPRAWAPH